MTKQEIVELLTRSLGRAPTEQEIVTQRIEYLKALGFKQRPPSGKGYIMPTGMPPKPPPKTPTE